MKTISFINQKGGVGKTTTCLNVGSGLSKKGFKVLMIDLDPQKHLSYSFGIDPDHCENTIFDLLKGKAKLKDAIVKYDNIDIVPSDDKLYYFEGNRESLKDALKGLRAYDYVLIDCPPTLSLLTLNVLSYVKYVLVVMQPNTHSIYGLNYLSKILEGLNKEISGIIFNLYDSRLNLHKEVILKMNNIFGKKVYNSLIRNNVSLTESPAHHKPIFDYKANSNGAKDFHSLTNEIIKKL